MLPLVGWNRQICFDRREIKSLILIRNYVLVNGFEGEFALRNIAEYCGNDANNGIPHSLIDHWQRISKCLDQHISQDNKGNSSEGIPEKLYPPM